MKKSEMKAKAEEFVNKWYYDNYYDYDFKDFWIDLLKNVLEIKNIEDLIVFNYKGLFAYIPSMGVVLDYYRGIMKNEDGDWFSSIVKTDEKLLKFKESERPRLKVLFDYDGIYLYTEELLNPEIVRICDLGRDFYELLPYFNNNTIFKFKVVCPSEFPRTPDEIVILDRKEYNTLVKFHHKDYAYSLSSDDLNEIKTIIDNYFDLLKNDIEIPPVLDGTVHDIEIKNKNKRKDILAYNLWYFIDEKPKRKNTKSLVEFLNKLQAVINKCGVHYILLTEDVEI